jgi:hypothetical protein
MLSFANMSNMLSVIMLSVIMLCVIMMSVIMMSVIMLSVIMLNVVAPTFAAKAEAYPSGSHYISTQRLPFQRKTV